MNFREQLIRQLSKISDSLELWLRRWFFVKTLLFALFVSYFFHFPNYANIPRENPNKVLLEIKESVFHQLDYPPQTHASKKTLRISIPLILKVFGVDSVYGIHVVFCFFNLLFLSALILWMKQETKDAVFSFIFTIGFVCIFPGNAGFCDTKGWGDIIPFTMLLFATISRNPIVIFGALLIALLGDERSVVGAMFIGMWWYWKRPPLKFSFLLSFRHPQIAAIVFAGLAFCAVRLYMVHSLGFENKLGAVGLAILSLPKEYIALGFWSSFEAYWLFALVPALYLFHQRLKLHGVVYSVAMVFLVIAGYTVHDITKSLSYGYLACIFGALFLHRHWGKQKEVQFLVLILALLCLIAPTQHIYGAHWLYAPFPVWVFEWVKQWALQTWIL